MFKDMCFLACSFACVLACLTVCRYVLSTLVLFLGRLAVGIPHLSKDKVLYLFLPHDSDKPEARYPKR